MERHVGDSVTGKDCAVALKKKKADSRAHKDKCKLKFQEPDATCAYEACSCSSSLRDLPAKERCTPDDCECSDKDSFQDCLPSNVPCAFAICSCSRPGSKRNSAPNSSRTSCANSTSATSQSSSSSQTSSRCSCSDDTSGSGRSPGKEHYKRSNRATSGRRASQDSSHSSTRCSCPPSTSSRRMSQGSGEQPRSAPPDQGDRRSEGKQSSQSSQDSNHSSTRCSCPPSTSSRRTSQGSGAQPRSAPPDQGDRRSFRSSEGKQSSHSSQDSSQSSTGCSCPPSTSSRRTSQGSGEQPRSVPPDQGDRRSSRSSEGKQITQSTTTPSKEKICPLPADQGDKRSTQSSQGKQGPVTHHPKCPCSVPQECVQKRLQQAQAQQVPLKGDPPVATQGSPRVSNKGSIQSSTRSQQEESPSTDLPCVPTSYAGRYQTKGLRYFVSCDPPCPDSQDLEGKRPPCGSKADDLPERRSIGTTDTHSTKGSAQVSGKCAIHHRDSTSSREADLPCVPTNYANRYQGKEDRDFISCDPPCPVTDDTSERYSTKGPSQKSTQGSIKSGRGPIKPVDTNSSKHSSRMSGICPISHPGPMVRPDTTCIPTRYANQQQGKEDQDFILCDPPCPRVGDTANQQASAGSERKSTQSSIKTPDKPSTHESIRSSKQGGDAPLAPPQSQPQQTDPSVKSAGTHTSKGSKPPPAPESDLPVQGSIKSSDTQGSSAVSARGSIVPCVPGNYAYRYQVKGIQDFVPCYPPCPNIEYEGYAPCTSEDAERRSVHSTKSPTPRAGEQRRPSQSSTQKSAPSTKGSQPQTDEQSRSSQSSTQKSTPSTKGSQPQTDEKSRSSQSSTQKSTPSTKGSQPQTDEQSRSSQSSTHKSAPSTKGSQPQTDEQSRSSQSSTQKSTPSTKGSQPQTDEQSRSSQSSTQKSTPSTTSPKPQSDRGTSGRTSSHDSSHSSTRCSCPPTPTSTFGRRAPRGSEKPAESGSPPQLLSTPTDQERRSSQSSTQKSVHSTKSPKPQADEQRSASQSSARRSVHSTKSSEPQASEQRRASQSSTQKSLPSTKIPEPQSSDRKSASSAKSADTRSTKSSRRDSIPSNLPCVPKEYSDRYRDKGFGEFISCDPPCRYSRDFPPPCGEDDYLSEQQPSVRVEGSVKSADKPCAEGLAPLPEGGSYLPCVPTDYAGRFQSKGAADFVSCEPHCSERNSFNVSIRSGQGSIKSADKHSSREGSRYSGKSPVQAAIEQDPTKYSEKRSRQGSIGSSERGSFLPCVPTQYAHRYQVKGLREFVHCYPPCPDAEDMLQSHYLCGKGSISRSSKNTVGDTIPEVAEEHQDGAPKSLRTTEDKYPGKRSKQGSRDSFLPCVPTQYAHRYQVKGLREFLHCYPPCPDTEDMIQPHLLCGKGSISRSSRNTVGDTIPEVAEEHLDETPKSPGTTEDRYPEKRSRQGSIGSSVRGSFLLPCVPTEYAHRYQVKGLREFVHCYPPCPDTEDMLEPQYPCIKDPICRSLKDSVGDTIPEVAEEHLDEAPETPDRSSGRGAYREPGTVPPAEGTTPSSQYGQQNDSQFANYTQHNFDRSSPYDIPRECQQHCADESSRYYGRDPQTPFPQLGFSPQQPDVARQTNPDESRYSHSTSAPYPFAGIADITDPRFFTSPYTTADSIAHETPPTQSSRTPTSGDRGKSPDIPEQFFTLPQDTTEGSYPTTHGTTATQPLRTPTSGDRGRSPDITGQFFTLPQDTTEGSHPTTYGTTTTQPSRTPAQISQPSASPTPGRTYTVPSKRQEAFSPEARIGNRTFDPPAASTPYPGGRRPYSPDPRTFTIPEDTSLGTTTQTSTTFTSGDRSSAVCPGRRRRPMPSDSSDTPYCCTCNLTDPRTYTIISNTFPSSYEASAGGQYSYVPDTTVATSPHAEDDSHRPYPVRQLFSPDNDERSSTQPTTTNTGRTYTVSPGQQDSARPAGGQYSFVPDRTFGTSPYAEDSPLKPYPVRQLFSPDNDERSSTQPRTGGTGRTYTVSPGQQDSTRPAGGQYSFVPDRTFATSSYAEDSPLKPYPVRQLFSPDNDERSSTQPTTGGTGRTYTVSPGQQGSTRPAGGQCSCASGRTTGRTYTVSPGQQDPSASAAISTEAEPPSRPTVERTFDTGYPFQSYESASGHPSSRPTTGRTYTVSPGQQDLSGPASGQYSSVPDSTFATSPYAEDGTPRPCPVRQLFSPGNDERTSTQPTTGRTYTVSSNQQDPTESTARSTDAEPPSRPTVERTFDTGYPFQSYESASGHPSSTPTTGRTYTVSSRLDGDTSGRTIPSGRNADVCPDRRVFDNSEPPFCCTCPRRTSTVASDRPDASREEYDSFAPPGSSTPYSERPSTQPTIRSTEPESPSRPTVEGTFDTGYPFQSYESASGHPSSRPTTGRTYTVSSGQQDLSGPAGGQYSSVPDRTFAEDDTPRPYPVRQLFSPDNNERTSTQPTTGRTYTVSSNQQDPTESTARSTEPPSRPPLERIFDTGHPFQSYESASEHTPSVPTTGRTYTISSRPDGDISGRTDRRPFDNSESPSRCTCSGRRSTGASDRPDTSREEYDSFAPPGSSTPYSGRPSTQPTIRSTEPEPPSRPTGERTFDTGYPFQSYESASGHPSSRPTTGRTYTVSPGQQDLSTSAARSTEAEPPSRPTVERTFDTGYPFQSYESASGHPSSRPTTGRTYTVSSRPDGDTSGRTDRRPFDSSEPQSRCTCPSFAPPHSSTPYSGRPSTQPTITIRSTEAEPPSRPTIERTFQSYESASGHPSSRPTTGRTYLVSSGHQDAPEPANDQYDSAEDDSPEPNPAVARQLFTPDSEAYSSPEDYGDRRFAQAPRPGSQRRRETSPKGAKPSTLQTGTYPCVCGPTKMQKRKMQDSNKVYKHRPLQEDQAFIPKPADDKSILEREVQNCKCFIADQEYEIGKLTGHIENMSKTRDGRSKMDDMRKHMEMMERSASSIATNDPPQLKHLVNQLQKECWLMQEKLRKTDEDCAEIKKIMKDKENILEAMQTECRKALDDKEKDCVISGMKNALDAVKAENGNLLDLLKKARVVNDRDKAELIERINSIEKQLCCVECKLRQQEEECDQIKGAIKEKDLLMQDMAASSRKAALDKEKECLIDSLKRALDDAKYENARLQGMLTKMCPKGDSNEYCAMDQSKLAVKKAAEELGRLLKLENDIANQKVTDTIQRLQSELRVTNRTLKDLADKPKRNTSIDTRSRKCGGKCQDGPNQIQDLVEALRKCRDKVASLEKENVERITEL